MYFTAFSRYNILEQNSSDGVQNTLVITDAILEDFGPYNCTAKNGYGSNTGIVMLNRQRKFYFYFFEFILSFSVGILRTLLVVIVKSILHVMNYFGGFG